MGSDDQFLSWHSLYAFLLTGDRGLKLKLGIPDTVVWRGGRPALWLFTGSDGCVQRQAFKRTTPADLKAHFLRYATVAEGSGQPECIAIARAHDGTPSLLSEAQFMALCDAAQAGGEAAQRVAVLQAYVAPLADARYLTSVIVDGQDVTCHSFQRRFTRRYLWAPPGGTSSGPAAADAGALAAALAAGAPPDAAFGGAETPDEGAEEPGSVDGGLRMQLRRAAHGVATYVQRAYGRCLRGLLLEFVRSRHGVLHMMAPLRVDWGPPSPGVGTDPWTEVLLSRRPLEEDSGEFPPKGATPRALAGQLAGLAGRLQQQGAGGGGAEGLDWGALQGLLAQCASALAARGGAEGAGPGRPHPPHRPAVPGLPRPPRPMRLPRATATLASHLTRELEAAREELAAETANAGALAAKVSDMDRERRGITEAFQRLLASQAQEVEALKDKLRQSSEDGAAAAALAEQLRQQLGTSEAARAALRAALDEERGAVIVALKDLQRQSAALAAAEAAARTAAAAEAAERAAAEAAEAKQADSNKYPVDEEGDGSSGAGCEAPLLRCRRTLAALGPLLEGEDDPAGERYALSKILAAKQADLTPVFLHYCLLDSAFARHWPPQLGASGWAQLLRDVAAGGALPGVRRKLATLLTAREAQQLFVQYAAVPLTSQPGSAAPGSGKAAAAASEERTLAQPAAGGLAGPEKPPLAGRPEALMGYSAFAAALVAAARRLAELSPEYLEQRPFLSDQAGAFLLLVAERAQRVAPPAGKPAGRLAPPPLPRAKQDSGKFRV